MERQSRRPALLGLAGLGLTLAAAAGCQTHIGGMTLPSPRYLQHPPQYIPPDPLFPLQRELATQEAQYGFGELGPAPVPNIPEALPPGPVVDQPLPGVPPG